MIDAQVASAALIEDHAFRFEHPALKLRLLDNNAARRNPPARIDDAMPRDITLVLRRGVHSPADQSRAVAVFEQASYLAVRHHAPARDAQHKAVYFFKRLLILFSPRGRRFIGFPLSAHFCHRFLSFSRAAAHHFCQSSRPRARCSGLQPSL